MFKKITVLFLCASFVFSSCAVQQFNVNTDHASSGYEVFGENTSSKQVAKRGEFFIIGINLTKHDTREMANEINANSYTVETKNNFVSFLVSMFTGGLIGYKSLKVIKR